jgi:hypothetical protein
MAAKSDESVAAKAKDGAGPATNEAVAHLLPGLDPRK